MERSKNGVKIVLDRGVFALNRGVKFYPIRVTPLHFEKWSGAIFTPIFRPKTMIFYVQTGMVFTPIPLCGLGLFRVAFRPYESASTILPMKFYGPSVKKSYSSDLYFSFYPKLKFGKNQWSESGVE